VEAQQVALELYTERSEYFRLWREHAAGDGFPAACQRKCSEHCDERASRFTPTRTYTSTLRPFACSTDNATCAQEQVVDVQAYHDVCIERCRVTCQQRDALFATFPRGQEDVPILE